MPTYPNEIQPATILKQVSFWKKFYNFNLVFMRSWVLAGLSYLLERRDHHLSLRCFTIIMGLDGVVKIGKLP
jgi:hypothetical protein